MIMPVDLECSGFDIINVPFKSSTSGFSPKCSTWLAHQKKTKKTQRQSHRILCVWMAYIRIKWIWIGQLMGLTQGAELLRIPFHPGAHAWNPQRSTISVFIIVQVFAGHGTPATVPDVTSGSVVVGQIPPVDGVDDRDLHMYRYIANIPTGN